MDLTRKEVIETLENIKEKRQLNNKRELDSLDYAISSLKTDEMYQLDYEGVQNIVVTEGMTNKEVLLSLFRTLNR